VKFDTIGIVIADRPSQIFDFAQLFLEKSGLRAASRPAALSSTPQHLNAARQLTPPPQDASIHSPTSAGFITPLFRRVATKGI